MLSKKIIIPVSILLLVGLAAFVGCRHSSPEKRADRFARYLADELDLSDEQRAMVDTFKNEINVRKQKMRADRHATMEAVMAQLKQETMDEAQLKTLIFAHRPQVEALIEYTIDSVAELHRSLTPEQRGRLIAKLEELQKWHSCFHED